MPSMEFLLSIGMLLTGALNTLSIKYQDDVVVAHTYDEKPITFYHPAVQCACMFLGEFLCIIPYVWQQLWQKWKQKPRAEARTPNQSPPLVYLQGSSTTEPLLRSRLPQALGYSPQLGSRGQAPPSTFSELGNTPRTGEDVSQSVFVLALPTLCDATSSILMNVGLFFTSASIFQMLRGLVVFWAGIFTVLILRRRLYLHHWQGMMLIVVGCFIVGLSSVLDEAAYTPRHYPPYEPPYGPPPDPYGDSTDSNVTEFLISSTIRNVLGLEDDTECTTGRRAGGFGMASDGEMAIVAWFRQLVGVLFLGLTWDGSPRDPSDDCKPSTRPLIGNLCVMAAQVFAALQYVVEEKYVKHYRIPASLAVGLEGFWGLVLSCLLLPLFQNLPGPNGWPIDDAKHIVTDIQAHPRVGVALMATILSFAFFNWFGLSLTISLSGAARLSIDACRTLLVWAISLWLGWESFHSTQLLGFLVIMCGTTLYNELLAPLVEPSQTPNYYRIGPQYRRSPAPAFPPGSAPYDVSPSLRIAVAITEPHSLASMGGMHTPSPGAEFWGISLDPTSSRSGRGSGSSAQVAARQAAVLTFGGRGGGAANAGTAAAAPPRPSLPPQSPVPASAPTSAPPRAGTMTSQPAARVPSLERSGSFYKYSAFYSGMDVGMTPPISTGGGCSSNGQGLSVTPRPNELLTSTAQQDWDGTAASATSGSILPASVPSGCQLGQATQSPPPPPLPVMTSELAAEAANTVAARSMLSEQLSRRQEDLNKKFAHAIPINDSADGSAIAPQSQQQFPDMVAAAASATDTSATGCGGSGSRVPFKGDDVCVVQAAQACGPTDLPVAPTAGSNRLKSAKGLQQSSSEPALLAKSRKGTAASNSGFGIGPHGRGGRTMSRRTRDIASHDSSAVVGVSAQSGLSELDMSGEFNLR